VASNLAWIGLAVSDTAELAQLLNTVMRSVHEVGVYDGVHVGRWQDDSGASLVLGWRPDEFLEMLPTYAATRGGLLSDCELINGEIASAAVVDADGEQLTSMAFQVEQYRQVQALGRPVDGSARITALGVDVQISHDADAFAASPASLLRQPDPADEPPQHFRERGWSWPPRVAAESFVPYGMFGEPGQASAHARLSGIVLTARRSICALTGQPFTIASVRTVGFEADLCLAGSEHPGVPAPGNVVSGTVFLSVFIDGPALQTA
jgi:hypothetical protein